MKFLDTFLRKELSEFVEEVVCSVDTPPSSPAVNGDVSVTASSAAPSTHSYTNTIYLAQKFIGFVSAFAPDAPHPDDLHTRFRQGITAFPEDAHLIQEQLDAFDNDYSALTRERAAAFYARQRETALLELSCARSTLRHVQAQHMLCASDYSTTELQTARDEFEMKRSVAQVVTKFAADSAGERTLCFIFISCPRPPLMSFVYVYLFTVETVLVYGVYWGPESEPPSHETSDTWRL